MKTKLKKWAVKLAKFVIDAVMDKLVLLVGGILIGTARKGWKAFRDKRSAERAEIEELVEDLTFDESDESCVEAEQTVENVEEPAEEKVDAEETPAEDSAE